MTTPTGVTDTAHPCDQVATATADPRPANPVSTSTLRRQGLAALRVLLVLTVLLGLVYPLGTWALSRLPGLHASAEGSLSPTGSTLIGIDPVPANPAADPWFHARPSASAPDDAPAGLGPADPSTSGGSNLAADSSDLTEAVTWRRTLVAAREGVAPAAVPADAVTASGSGVDPEISPAYADLQIRRVARVTGLGPDRVRALVAQATRGRSLGILGEPGVDLTELNALILRADPAAR